MAKHRGMTIRIGAAYDEVQTPAGNFDRAAMRKTGGYSGETYIPGRVLVDRLNKEIVNVYCDVHDLNRDRKDKRAMRIARKQKDRRHD